MFLISSIEIRILPLWQCCRFWKISPSVYPSSWDLSTRSCRMGSSILSAAAYRISSFRANFPHPIVRFHLFRFQSGIRASPSWKKVAVFPHASPRESGNFWNRGWTDELRDPICILSVVECCLLPIMLWHAFRKSWRIAMMDKPSSWAW